MTIWQDGLQELFQKFLKNISSNSILILGACFKPNCPDLRNSQSMVLAKLLTKYGFEVEVVDYLATKYKMNDYEGISINSKPLRTNGYGIIICTVAHEKYACWQDKDWLNLKENNNSLIFDIQNVVPRNLNPIRF